MFTFRRPRPILEQIWNTAQSGPRPSSPRRRLHCLYSRSRLSICFDYIPSNYIFKLRTSNSKLGLCVGLYSLKFPATWLGLSFYAFLQSTSTAELKNCEAKEEEVDIDTLIFEADDLFDQYKYSEVVELLQNLKECENADILWRLCRALYYMSKEENGNKSQELIIESYSLVKRALELDDNNYAVHKWYSVLLDAHAFTQGFRARLNEILNVKHHMMRAMELNPKDATTLYMLGSWCFGVSELPWFQRKIVVTLVGSFPSSSFEEALFYFQKAEETNPRFYSLNLLMLGKTYLKLNNTDEARRYLTMASTYPARSDEDQQANKEAADLLKKLTT